MRVLLHDILGSRYMFLTPEERFHDDPQQSLFGGGGEAVGK